jgi:hypothetical protein
MAHHRDPLTQMEKLVFGADAVRDPLTGEIWEQGLHAHPPAVQRAQFLEKYPQHPRAATVATPAEVAQPAAEKEAEARASAVETAAEVKKLATDEEATKAVMVILNHNAAATKH